MQVHFPFRYILHHPYRLAREVALAQARRVPLATSQFCCLLDSHEQMKPDCAPWSGSTKCAALAGGDHRTQHRMFAVVSLPQMQMGCGASSSLSLRWWDRHRCVKVDLPFPFQQPPDFSVCFYNGGPKSTHFFSTRTRVRVLNISWWQYYSLSASYEAEVFTFCKLDDG